MIYTPLTCKAMDLAYQAHHGQRDKAGLPYIFHPYHLAEQMSDEISVCTALLHDVLEDSDIGREELEKEFPAEVMDALSLLTHTADTEYFDYIRKIRHNPVAREVKLADLRHNADETRLVACPAASRETTLRRREKYAWAIAILEETLP